MPKIKFIANAVTWWDRSAGNTYNSVRITRTEDGANIVSPMQYGYGDAYRQFALQAMAEAGWLPEKYRENPYLYERENEYPIYWTVRPGTKKECQSNGEEG